MRIPVHVRVRRARSLPLYIAICADCDFYIPFRSEDDRNEFAQTHADNYGHTVMAARSS